MTSEQAQKAVEACEKQLQRAYADLYEEARDAAEETYRVAVRTIVKRSAILVAAVLLVSTVAFNVVWYAGVLSAVAGLCVIYSVYSGLKEGEMKIARDREQLEKTLEEWKKI